MSYCYTGSAPNGRGSWHQEPVWEVVLPSQPHRELTGGGVRLRTLQLVSQPCTSSSKAPSSKCPRTFPGPTAGDQVFKYLSLWGTLLIQRPHSVNIDVFYVCGTAIFILTLTSQLQMFLSHFFLFPASTLLPKRLW